ncbi:MAG: alpha/beta hydrolase-fold protein [Caldilineales bacterium]
MKSLTHRDAWRLMEKSRLDAVETARLDDHLRTCSECTSYARTDRFLRLNLAVAPVRSQPTPGMHKAVLLQAHRGRNQSGMARLAGSLAFLVLLAVIGAVALYAFRVTSPGASEPLAQQLASPLQTMVAIIAPPVVATPEPSPTPRSIPESPAGRIIIDVPAPSLASSIIGESTMQPVAVILPPSYATSDRRYPVAYLFVSGNQTPDRTDEDDLVEIIAAKLTSQGSMQEMIVVVPAVRTVLDTEVVMANSPVTGNWEDYVVEDLVPFIDQNFRTLPQAAAQVWPAGRRLAG